MGKNRAESEAAMAAVEKRAREIESRAVCESGKLWFRSKSAANKYRRGRGRTTRPTEAYDCPSCDGWHLATKMGHKR